MKYGLQARGVAIVYLRNIGREFTRYLYSPPLRVNETIKNAQKVALDYLSPGTAVIKYGICIGHATQDVKAGDCIHLYNLSNDYDERSETLDLQSGLSTDMVYE